MVPSRYSRANPSGRRDRRPHNHQRDYHDKPRIYAEAGIPTFLRIELTGAARLHIEVFRLSGGAYTLVAKASAGQTLDLAEPFPVTSTRGTSLGAVPGETSGTPQALMPSMCGWSSLRRARFGLAPTICWTGSRP